MNVLSVGIIPIMVGIPYKYLLLRSGSYWDFPKGLVEDKEDPIETALRELLEETGLEQVRFSWGQCYVETLPYGRHNKIARYYLVEILQPIPEIIFSINPELGYPEHEEFFWSVYSEAKKLVGSRVSLILDWAHLKVKNGIF